jgi:exodeoxyribonuclease VIII
MTRLALNLPDADYRAAPGVSASSLRPLRGTPADYAYAIANPQPSSPSQALGTLVHLAVLTPDLWGRVRVAPDVDRRTKAGKDAYSAYVHTLDAGDILATAEDRNLAFAMVDAIERHPIAGRWISPDAGHAEASLFWQDSTSQLDCKARLDLLRRDGWIVDLKTTREEDLSAVSWAREVARHDYHVQLAHYWAGAHAVATLGETQPPAGWAWVVVSSVAPHHVAVHVADGRWLEIGERERRRRLETLAECRRSGVYPAYPDPQSCEPPRWLLNSDDNR